MPNRDGAQQENPQAAVRLLFHFPMGDRARPSYGQY